MREGWIKVNREEFSKKRSKIQKEIYLNLSEAEKEKINKKRSETLKNKKNYCSYQILTPEGEILELKSLYLWCKEIFENYKSAAACFYNAGRYNNYTLINKEN